MLPVSRVRPKIPSFHYRCSRSATLPLCRRTFATEASTKLPKKSILRRSLNAAKYTSYVLASSVVGLGVITAAIFIHDAFTYTERHIDRVPVNPLALHPERGGKKNLPIARVLVDDEEDEEVKKLADKPKLVIIGGGWGVSDYLRLDRTC